MSDLDPEIWNNKTLGEAAENGFADEMEAQEIENRAAKREGREPMLVRRIHRYPGSQNDVSISSSYDNGLRYVDPNTLQPGPGEFSEVKTEGEASNADHGDGGNSSVEGDSGVTETL